MDYRTLSNAELIRACFAMEQLSPLEVELLHRVECLVDQLADMDNERFRGDERPTPDWVEAMFPELRA